MKMHGKDVIDAVKPLSVTITAGDLAKAQPQDPTACAIAQSLRREKGVTRVSVGASMVYVVFATDSSKVVRYALSNNERALIKAFDKQGQFPCGYRVRLEPVPASRQIGARAGGAQGTNKRSGAGGNALQRASRSQPTRHVATPA